MPSSDIFPLGSAALCVARTFLSPHAQITPTLTGSDEALPLSLYLIMNSAYIVIADLIRNLTLIVIASLKGEAIQCP